MILARRRLRGGEHDARAKGAHSAPFHLHHMPEPGACGKPGGVPHSLPPHARSVQEQEDRNGDG